VGPPAAVRRRHARPPYGGERPSSWSASRATRGCQIPAYTTPTTGERPGAEAKINTAFFVGGPALLVSTVEQLSGLTIDHYMQVDFDGFRAIIDEVDGVEVCLSKPAKEPKSGIDLPAGARW
jgi:LCP family protein required for cell wall assembly